MLTKGIVVSVHEMDNNKSNVYKYRVRIPILHGYKGSPGFCPDDRLPDACVYSSLPGEQTKLQVGDVVLVDLADYNPEWPVILGLLPHSADDMLGQYINTAGADKTTSGLSIKNVQNITFDTDDGRAYLPKNTRVYTKDDIGGREFVNGTELGQLKYVKQPIQLQLDDLSQSIASVLSSLSSANVWVQSDLSINNTITVSDSKHIGNIEYNKKLDNTRAALWLNNSHKNVLDYNYIFKYIGDNQWEYPPNNPSQIVTKNNLASWGIDYTSVPDVNDLLYVAITIGVIPIEMGGTGADNDTGARRNLKVFKDKLMSETEFDSLSSTDYELDTIYYIYEET